MSSIKATFADGVAHFQLHESKCWGTPDRFYTKTVRVDEGIQELPALSSDKGCSFPREADELFLYWVSDAGVWAGFHLNSYPEKSMGPDEATFSGPFRFPFETPPTPAEVARSRSEGLEFVFRRRDRFGSETGRRRG